MKILLVSATFWESRRLIKQAGFLKIAPRLYMLEKNELQAFLRISGVGRENVLGSLAEALKGIGEKPDLILSIGFAGGLKDGAGVGDLVLDAVQSSSDFLSKAVRLAAGRRLGVHAGRFLTVEIPLMTSEEKRSAYRSSGAIAAEMEGDSVARFCRDRGIAYGAIRAVSDTAGQNIPQSVGLLDSGGRPGFRFWRGILFRPAEWADFMNLAWASGRAGSHLALILKDILNAYAVSKEPQ
jgi:nucleoside phosphorylase